MIPTAGLFALLAPRKAEILAGAVAQAQMAGAQPSLDMVKTAGLNVARQMACEMLMPQCHQVLSTAAMMYVLVHGPRPEALADDPAYIAWRDQFDEAVMDAIGPEALRSAGQDFIGEYLTDAELDEAAVCTAAARTMSDNIIRTAISDRQPGQVLAEIGIVHDDLLAFVPAGAAAAPAAAPIIESVARAHVERLVGNFAIKTGIGNMDAIVELLKGAFDDDPFLPLEFIRRLDGQDSDAPYFAAYYKAAGKDALANTQQAAMMAALTGQIVEPAKEAPKAPKGRKPKATPAAAVAPPPVVAPAAPDAPAVPNDGDVTEVLRLMLEHGRDNMEEVGKLVGKSRASMNNVKNGKATIKATKAQRTQIRSLLSHRLAGLQLALEKLT